MDIMLLIFIGLLFLAFVICIFSLKRKLGNKDQEIFKVREELNIIESYVHLAIWNYDATNHKFETSKEWLSMLGIESPPANFTSFVSDFVHADDQRQLLAAFREYVEGTSNSYHINYRVRSHGNRYIHIEDFGRIVTRDDDGMAVELIGVSKNITRHIKADELTMKQLSLLQSIVTSSPMEFWTLDLESNTIHMNEFFGRITGEELGIYCTLEEVEDLIHSADQSGFKDAIENFKKSKKAVLKYKYRMKVADGSWRWVESYGVAYKRDDNGAPQRLSGVTICVDELETSNANLVTMDSINKTLNAEVEVLKKEKEIRSQETLGFVKDISFEIERPLSAINEICAYTKELLDDDNKILVDIIKSSANSIATNLNEILTISRVNNNDLEFKPVAFDLELIADALTERDLSRVKFDVDFSNTTATKIYGNKNLFNIVIRSITLFLTEYSLKEKIDVSITELKVDDNLCLNLCFNNIELKGEIDIKTAIENKSFESLFLESKNAFEISEVLVKRWVSCIKGSYLREDNKLEVIIPYIPFDSEQEEETGKESINMSELKEVKGKVLIVDDSEVNRTLIQLYLSDTSLEVEFAENGKEAVQMFQAHDFDLIFMDIQMPIMDGYDATIIIRRIESKSPEETRIPIVAVSAYSMNEEIEKCIEVGADETFLKPVKKGPLQDVIFKYLKRTN